MKCRITPAGVVEPCDVMEWGPWFESAGDGLIEDGGRTVAKTTVPGADISTVFIGLGGQIFETMIFGGEHDQYQERYSTLEEARAGHARAVALAEGREVPR